MQYLLSVIDEVSEIDDQAGLASPEEESAAVRPPDPLDAFNARLEAEGHWVFAGGLGEPGTATVIDNRGEQVVLTDGPFTESKEYLGGFWIIEAADLDTALKLAAEGSKACNRKVEVRPFG
jgi:hypothetical protein